MLDGSTEPPASPSSPGAALRREVLAAIGNGLQRPDHEEVVAALEISAACEVRFQGPAAFTQPRSCL